MSHAVFHKRIKPVSLAGRILVRTGVYLLLIALSFVLIYPILYMITMAFRPLSELKDPTTVWITNKWTFDNLKTMWDYMELDRVLLQSGFISFFSALFSTAVCALTGYGFARFRFKEKGIWMAILFATIIVPPSVVSVAAYIQMNDFPILGIVPLIEWITGQSIKINLLDTVWVYFLPAMFGAGISSGIFVLVYYQFFRSFPEALEDSAYVDGAGAARTFVRIVLPNMRAPTIVVFLLSMVWYWNDSDISTTFTLQLQTISGRLLTVYSDMTQILGAASGHGTYHEDVPLIQAAMLIAVIPMLALFLLCQRSFVKSVATAGIVG